MFRYLLFLNQLVHDLNQLIHTHTHTHTHTPYLNNTAMRQEETIKYLGIIIVKRLNFNAHIDYTTGKCIKLIRALSKSVKVNWGLRNDVLRMIYFGAILPILSYGAQVWVDSLQRKSNASKLRRIQRLIFVQSVKSIDFSDLQWRFIIKDRQIERLLSVSLDFKILLPNL